MQAGLLVAAVVPAITAVWAVVLLATNQDPTTVELNWVGGLDIGFRFRADAVSLMMTLLVSGIGALVFVYASGYFSPGAAGGTRFPASLLAFSTAMLGLVWSDSIWTLFIFWEFTTISSFLLVGHKNYDPITLAAARRALMITGAGGLVLLAGLLVLASQAGTTVLTEMVPVDGAGATLAAVLILIGAATKSAQVPFHIWLPGAMTAPTPVSAYLHSATMVKAGVLLIAVLSTTFSEVATWKVLGLGFGIASMLWGAIGALRHRDAKLILAWGTVSQLGFIITLLATGTDKGIFAATSVLFAHALFKAALFLVVGEIDIRTGTRNIDELNGLVRSMPITFGVAVLGALSMAGVPPLLGFSAKEAAIEAAIGLKGPEADIVGFAIIGGSVLTVAYTIRFLVTVFGPTDGPLTEVSPMRPAMTFPAVFLGLAGLVGYFIVELVNPVVVGAATELNPGAGEFVLFRWPGLKPAFFISAAVVAGGSVVGAVLARGTKAPPDPIGADMADDGLDGILRLARGLTVRAQHGSLPVYLATMGITATLAATPFLADLRLDHLVLWDNPIQGLLAAATVASAIFGALVGSRLGAALTLGAVGLGVSGLFVVHGAPDLVLTQLLVETVIVVGFVIGLGGLSRRFPRSPGTWRLARLFLSFTGGAAVVVGLVAAGGGSVGEAPIEEITVGSVEVGGGNNVVNVVLTDLRALDTLGEVVVLATVAIGVLALAKAGKNDTEEVAA